MENAAAEGIHKCVWCGAESALACSCGEAWYCTREHQRRAWAEDHFRECKSYKTRSTPGEGEHLVASRNLKAGAHIFTDDPILLGPLGTSDLVCLACHSPIYEDNFFRCPCCHWPMCSMDCAAAKCHDDECDILARDEKQCGPPTTQGETPRYDLIIILRALLLKSTHPKMWKVLMSMASHGCHSKETEDPHQIAAVRYLTEVCQIDCDVDTIHYVRGVIRTNALQVRGSSGSMLRALYENVRLFNHSCLPNIHLSTNLDGIMVTKTAIPVKKGEALSICYTGTDVPIWERQMCLSDVHYFDCRCKRCADPTEMGSMFSSSRCPVCPHQIMNISFCDNEIVWTCPKCNTQNSMEEIKQEIEEWTFRLEMNELFGTGTPNRISHALAIVKQQFHIKHYMWLKTGQAAIRKLRYNDSLAARKLKKYIWEKILDIYDIIEPGLTRRRAMILLELGNHAYHLATEGYLEKGELSIHQALSLLQEAKRVYEESYTILRVEPRGTPEREMARGISEKTSLVCQRLREIGV